MKNLIGLIAGGMFIVGVFSPVFAGNIIKMTYKDGDKMPLINKSPDNTGLYMDLFTKAAQKIGYTLEIERMPKKRLHKKLEKGQLDFYPGASFSKKRSNYLYYIENGLSTGEYGITAADIPDIQNYDQVKQNNLIWLMELGSSKTEKAKSVGAETQFINFADIDKVKDLVSKGRNIFYVADKELIDYYLKEKKTKSFKDVGLKVHPNCCGGDYPMYMGFSRFSPLFKEYPNPKYNPAQEISPQNFPTAVDPECVAYKLGQALQELKASGITDKLYKQYFSE